MEALSDAINLFSFNLFVNSQPGVGTSNTLLSPTSVYYMMSMLYGGAEGSTKMELSSLLQLDKLAAVEKFHDDLPSLMKSISLEDEDILVNLSARIFIQLQRNVKDNYQKFLSDKYETEIDIASNVGEAAKIINQWIAIQTLGKIMNTISRNDLSVDTPCVAVNTLYMKAKWAKPFVPLMTNTEAFNLIDGSSIDVPMMSMDSHFSWREMPDMDATILRLPFKNNDCAMDILLPNKPDGILHLLQSFEKSDDSFRKLLNLELESHPVRVKLPKFKISNKFSLQEILNSLGVEKLFKGDANLKGISDDILFVSRLIHEVYIEVNEEGVEAAATTAAVMANSYAPRNSKIFHVTHPFLFAIVNQKERVPLFVAKVMNPMA